MSQILARISMRFVVIRAFLILSPKKNQNSSVSELVSEW